LVGAVGCAVASYNPNHRYYGYYDGEDYYLSDSNDNATIARTINESNDYIILIDEPPLTFDKAIKLIFIYTTIVYKQDENTTTSFYITIELRNQSGVYYNQARFTPWNYSKTYGIAGPLNAWETIVTNDTELRFWVEVRDLNHNLTIYYGEDYPCSVQINYLYLSGPIVDAGIDVNGIINKEIQFTTNATNEDANNTLFEWDFNGDGIYDWSGDTPDDILYKYEEEGTYTAILRVTDEYGYNSTDSINIQISASEDDDPSISIVTSMLSLMFVTLITARKKKN